MRRWIDVAADLVLGATCPGCDDPGWGTCRRCRAELEAVTAFAVTRSLPDFPVATSGGVYAGSLRRLVAAHKERGARHAGPLLGSLLASAVVRQGSPGPLTLVPVPSTPAAVRSRGYDSVLLIASDAARRLRRSGRTVVVSAALRHVRRLEDQAGLDTAARWENLRGAMVARPVQGRVLVVDDVCTTGATLTEACRALLEAGAGECCASTVSATVLRRRL
ncbi:MAG: ComF family protein [Propionibacteriaceae bacterium]